MIHALQPFTPSSRHVQIHFSVERTLEGLDFSFSLLGARPADLAQVVMRPLNLSDERRRRDELWKSTCLELFVGDDRGRHYLELNLCPSGDWNLYAFDNYREGMRPVEPALPPLRMREASPAGDRATFQAHLRKTIGGDATKILSSPSLVLGATAVLEYQDGIREYWALTHAGEKPDFHLRESFRLIL
jgi:hypothetical protein